MAALGNTDTAIVCANFNGVGTTIGGPGAGEGNVISGNARGIWISQGNSVNVVQGNRIGVNAAGTGPARQRRRHLHQCGRQRQHHRRHRTRRSQRDRLQRRPRASSSRPTGVRQLGSRQLDPRQRRPRHRPRQRRRAQLQRSRWTPTTAPTTCRTSPSSQTVEHLGPQGAGSTRLAGKLHSAPSTTFDLDFYANPACSNFPREFVEGETWLGSSSVTTDASGDAAFDETFPVADRGRRPHLRHGNRSGRKHLGVLPAHHLLDHRRRRDRTPEARPSTSRAPTSPTRPRSPSAASPPSGVTFVNDHQLYATMPAFPPGPPRTSSSRRPTAPPALSSRAGSPTSSTSRRPTSSTTSS